MDLNWHFAEETADTLVDIRAFVDGQKYVSKSLGSADLVAREVIQNSWDAFNLDTRPGLSRAERLRINFRFVHLAGDAKQTFLNALNWDQLCHIRAGAKSEEQGVDVYSAIRDKREVTLLIASDYGGPGLYGSPTDPRGNWVSALTKLHGGRAGGQGGGSYGVGKTAFIRAGGVPTIAAYSCFAPALPGEPSRRGQAFAYWWNFLDTSDVPRVGLGRLAEAGSQPHLPLTDGVADEWARQLGIALRNPGDPGQTGLDLLIIEPQFNAQELAASVESYWWPALVGDKPLEVTVADRTGTVPVDPYEREDLQAFLETFQTLNGPLSRYPQAATDHRWKEGGSQGVSLGDCLLRPVSSPPAAPDASESALNLSSHRVAMIRNTHMVLWYHKPHGLQPSRPAIQGTYLMESDEGSRLLRATEPGFHDDWVTNEKNAVGEQKRAVKFAGEVKSAVNAHARAVYAATAGTSAEEGGKSALAREILKDLLPIGREIGPPPPPPPGSLKVSIRRQNRTIDPVISTDPQIRMVSTSGGFLVSREAGLGAISVEIAIAASVVQGRTDSGETVGVTVQRLPIGFAQVGGDASRLRGQLDGSVEIPFRTDAYPEEYTINVRCEVTEL